MLLDASSRFLVFDHMENRSLKECLHGNAAVTFQADYFFLGDSSSQWRVNTDVPFLADPLRTPLDWRTRLQVAIDVAAALVKHHQITLEIRI